MSKKYLFIVLAVGIILIIGVITSFFNNQKSKSDLETRGLGGIPFQAKQSNAQQNSQNLSIIEINTARRMKYRNRFDKYITVHADTSTVNATPIFVSNKTEYNLNEVVVKIEYLNKDDKIDTTATIQFLNVQPGLTKSVITTLKTKERLRLKCLIDKISSVALNFRYPSNNGSPEDQFFYRFNNE